MLLYSIHKYTLIICVSSFFSVFSQIDFETISKEDTVSFLLDEILLEDKNQNLNFRMNYILLKRRVLKVYPYIDSIAQIIEEADSSLESFNKKRLSKRYTRKFQKKIINHFRKNVSNLTRKEGAILSKLIYREFNMTSYDIISKYRGNWRAFWWQRLSKLYDGNLKSTFHPQNNKEDLFIEYIINQYID